MSSINWSEPHLFMRGCVINAVVAEGDDQTLSAAFHAAWQRAADVIERLRYPELPTAIIVELWQDTGRIIFVIKQRRDLVRIVLTCPEIERDYFTWDCQSSEFAQEYERQFRRLVKLVQKECMPLREAFKSFATDITIRDSDDDEKSIRL